MVSSLKNNEKKCFYCTKDGQLQELMIFIDSMQVSNLYLSKDQAHRGRCIIALHEHERELFHVDTKTLHQFSEDVSRSAYAISQAVGADKMNYAIYGDNVSHLHAHLVPKYENGLSWGEAFENNPLKKTIILEAEYRKLIAQIKEHLY